MDSLMGIGLAEWAIAFAVSAVAGFIKGVVGFAFPMIMISGVGLLFEPDFAVALLIVPLFAVNLLQAIEGGLSSILSIIKQHRRLVGSLLTCLFLAAQIAWLLPKEVFYAIIGLPICLVAILQLAGWRLRLPERYRNLGEYVAGAASGIFGGFAGVWAPLVVTYLVALDKPVRHIIQAQGAIYLAGSIMLIAAHVRSGILNEATVWPSLALVIPAVGGLTAGTLIRNRLDKEKFRRFTLIVLAVAGFNLALRAMIS